MVPYDRHIPYNDLPSLPPSLECCFDPEIMRKFAIASRKLAELKGLASLLPNQSIFVNTISLREAKASSAIENIFTTDDELYRALTYQDDVYVHGPAKEILHYREALWGGVNRLAAEGKLTERLIIDVYRKVTQSHDGIRPYQAEVVIKKRGWGSLVGETVYTPPRGRGIVEKLLADLIEFLNDDEKYPMDPLLKMMMAHYQFECIHPFRDGNGRTGRILCILYLIYKGLLDMPILYMSAYVLRNKDKYYFELNNLTGQRDWKPWISFMLDAVLQTSEYTIYKINMIRELMTRTKQAIPQTILSKIDIYKLFEQPYVRPKSLMSSKVKSLNTAKKYLSDLESLGLLSKEKIGKEYVWLNTGLMDILSSEE